jgi:DinB superfamily
MNPEPLPEPWLRGPIDGVDPLIAPVLYAFQQAREDLSRYTNGLTPAQLWARPHGFGSAGFHIRHIALSTERLMSYLEERPLTQEQLAALDREHEAGMDREELLAELDCSLRGAEAIVRRIDPSTLAAPRFVGRKRLPTTVIGLLTHIAEPRSGMLDKL